MKCFQFPLSFPNNIAHYDSPSVKHQFSCKTVWKLFEFLYFTRDISRLMLEWQ